MSGRMVARHFEISIKVFNQYLDKLFKKKFNLTASCILSDIQIQYCQIALLYGHWSLQNTANTHTRAPRQTHIHLSLILYMIKIKVLTIFFTISEITEKWFTSLSSQ